jgi:hypothetical protein
VFFGTNNPYQLEESKPGMVSATVGHHLAQVVAISFRSGSRGDVYRNAPISPQVQRAFAE